MTEAEVEQAKAWTRLRGWRWMPGMLIADNGPGVRYCWSDEHHHHGACERHHGWMRIGKAFGSVPDVTDPATIGCLTQLVRDITGAHLDLEDPWRAPVAPASVIVDPYTRFPCTYLGASLAEALLKAAQAWEADHE